MRYESSEESKYITYLDANNLYGWAMSQYLPYSRFNWLNKKKISDFTLNSISENSSIVYTLEVDLEYLEIKKNLKLVKICCQNIVLILKINMDSKSVELIN